MTDIEDLVADAPLGTSWADSALPTLPDKGAREFALRALRQFVCALTFRQTAAAGNPAKGFRVTRERFHIYQPDDVVELEAPGIGVLPGAYEHDYYGLGAPELIESTADRYGKGLVVARLSDYVETVTLDCVATQHAIRRSLIEGLKVAMRLGGTSGALRLRLPDYYDAIATFSLPGGPGYLDDVETAKNRRRAQMAVELRVPELVLVPYTTLTPSIDLGGDTASNVFDGSVWLDFGVTAFDPRRYVR